MHFGYTLLPPSHGTEFPLYSCRGHRAWLPSHVVEYRQSESSAQINFSSADTIVHSSVQHLPSLGLKTKTYCSRWLWIIVVIQSSSKPGCNTFYVLIRIPYLHCALGFKVHGEVGWLAGWQQLSSPQSS